LGALGNQNRHSLWQQFAMGIYSIMGRKPTPHPSHFVQPCVDHAACRIEHCHIGLRFRFRLKHCIVSLPVPFGPIMALNCLKGPIVCFPLYDLKLSNSMYFNRPGILLRRIHARKSYVFKTIKYRNCIPTPQQ